jgi:outer membrane protein TolC
MLAFVTLFLAASEPLTLARAVELARARNERPQIAAEQAAAAAARLDRARAFFFPELALTATYTRRAYEVTRDVGGQPVVIQSLNALNGNATVGSVIFDARGIPLYRAAAADLEAARLDASEAERLIGFEAADAFLQTLALMQVRGAAEHRLALAKESLHDASTRFEAQLVSSNDVTKAELELANAQAQLTSSQNDVERARLSLGLLLATPPPEELVEPQAPEPTLEPEQQLISDALATRGDLRALEARQRSARLFAQEPLMRLLPTLSLTAQLRGTNEAGLSGNTIDGFGALTLGWVLFDGGERCAERNERLALTRVAELNTQAAGRATQVQVSTALVTIANAKSSLTQSQAAATAARKNAGETAELYRQGLAGALDAQDARVRLFEAEVAQARSRYGLQLAHLELRAATGLQALAPEVQP